jgi:hypothetical protein
LPGEVRSTPTARPDELASRENRIFGTHSVRLHLLEAKAYPTGNVMLRYEPQHAIPTLA